MGATIQKQGPSFLEQISASGLYDNENLVIRNSDRLIKDVQGYLKAAGYDTALACMDLAINKKRELYRKDGKTPSIIHEISQVLYTISLIEDGVPLGDPESIIALNFVHDLGEDFGLKPDKLKLLLIGKGIPESDELNLLVQDFHILQKKYKGEATSRFKNEWEYYQGIQESMNASIAKMPDRLNNLATQIGVLSNERALQYIANTEVILNDFIKYVSNKFPIQKEAYGIYKKMISTTAQINRYHLAEKDIGKPLPDINALAEKEKPERGFKLPKGLNPICINAQRVLNLSCLPESFYQAVPATKGLHIN